MKILSSPSFDTVMEHSSFWRRLAAAQQIAKDTASAVSSLVVEKASPLSQRNRHQNFRRRSSRSSTTARCITHRDGLLHRSEASNSRKSQAGFGLFPHTLPGARLAPKLSLMLGKGIICGFIGYRNEAANSFFVRNVSGKKRRRDVTFVGQRRGSPPFNLERSRGFGAPLILLERSPVIRRHCRERDAYSHQPLDRFKEAKSAVDLTQGSADRCTGRGIKRRKIFPSRRLAKSNCGEICRVTPDFATKLAPMERQSQLRATVAQKLYLRLASAAPSARTSA